MHPALKQHDIVALVFAQLDNEESYETRLTTNFVEGSLDRCRLERSQRQTMLSCALTCRFFKEPAMDILWKELDSPTPLLRLISCCRGIDGRLVLNGPLISEELERFRNHARRVRTLRYECSRTDMIDPLVFSRLSLYLGTPILPRLRTLVWEISSRSAVPLTLITPSMECICILFRWDCGTMTILDHTTATLGIELLYKTLVTTCASIKTIHICGLYLELPPVVQLTVFRSLKSLTLITSRYLEGLRVPGGSLFSHEQLATLSEVADLVHLRLDVTGLTVIGTAQYRFRSLAHVTLLGYPCNISTVLDAIQSSPITKISLVLFGYDEEVGVMLRTIGFPSLKVLAVELSEWIDYEPLFPEPLAAHHLLESLLKCRDLERLHIETELLPVSMRDHHIWSMAQAWPHLIDLSWNFESEPNPPTVASLVAFMKHCPNLNRLSIPIDLTISLPDNLSFSTHGLEVLKARGPWNPECEYDAAQWLVCLFPNLNSIEMMDAVAGSNVDDLLEVYQALQRERSMLVKQFTSSCHAEQENARV
ncbi:hypothetical protein NEOLEDRAFT_116598 [Neolentinus lepideus HHB14362 ss-1]|uniref:F-box domain-containing protein n=1 Tax=Neolentinus lepideus HHB14362 ss-1 TaxID=1314782 RepID=A0A165MUD5_9AGAM|nr:hypothetical protein NEOLEDRAFT_116598 [Neolentinus lepideus HHB14362 ss-1]